MALTKVNTGGLAADAVDNTILKLDDAFAFSGTVSGVGGITHVDQWRLTTTFSGSAQPIASNLERVDTGGQGTIGSAMTVSSGIFTFPVTGIWVVRYIIGLSREGHSRYQTAYIQATTDNSNYVALAENNSHIYQYSARTYTTQCIESTVDVTNVSNVKVKFSVTPSQADALTHGDSTHNNTTFTFIRLGDT